MSNTFYWIAVIAVTVISAARITRLLVIDKFPPVKRVRVWYETKTDGSDWQWLTMCAYCMSPWVTAFVFGTGLLCNVYAPGDRPIDGTFAPETNLVLFLGWWVFFGWLALSYLAAMTVARDGAVSEDD